MAVMVSADVPGQTQAGYQATVDALHEGIMKAPGFIMHMTAPSEDGWTVIEVWESKKEANDWFAHNVAPALPEGITPRRRFRELYNVIAA
jgi:heme-degrading monooxygenase HmoA